MKVRLEEIEAIEKFVNTSFHKAHTVQPSRLFRVVVGPAEQVTGQCSSVITRARVFLPTAAGQVTHSTHWTLKQIRSNANKKHQKKESSLKTSFFNQETENGRGFPD